MDDYRMRRDLWEAGYNQYGSIDNETWGPSEGSAMLLPQAWSYFKKYPARLPQRAPMNPIERPPLSWGFWELDFAGCNILYRSPSFHAIVHVSALNSTTAILKYAIELTEDAGRSILSQASSAVSDLFRMLEDVFQLKRIMAAAGSDYFNLVPAFLEYEHRHNAAMAAEELAAEDEGNKVFGTYGSASGLMSSRQPNMQNIPARTTQPPTATALAYANLGIFKK